MGSTRDARRAGRKAARAAATTMVSGADVLTPGRDQAKFGTRDRLIETYPDSYFLDQAAYAGIRLLGDPEERRRALERFITDFPYAMHAADLAGGIRTVGATRKTLSNTVLNDVTKRR
jgi:hypothetical protein